MESSSGACKQKWQAAGRSPLSREGISPHPRPLSQRERGHLLESLFGVVKETSGDWSAVKEAAK